MFNLAETSQGADSIPRIWEIQYFCSSSIYVVCNIDEMSLRVVGFIFLLLKVRTGDWQAPASSSSEGCSTWHKPVKVQTEYLEYGRYNIFFLV